MESSDFGSQLAHITCGTTAKSNVNSN
uniref:Uncharacterized protein n=1 Tax=Heterorhabditis bacteriophora TaxID=37862 RepID=A0A1I7W8E7_HETBA